MPFLMGAFERVVDGGFEALSGLLDKLGPATRVAR